MLAGCATDPAPAVELHKLITGSTQPPITVGIVQVERGIRDVYACAQKTIRSEAIPGGLAADDAIKLTTGWSPRPGKMLGIALWRKQWQERERFIITFYVAPGSETKSLVDVTAELEERPNDSYAWTPIGSDRKSDAADRAAWAINQLVNTCAGGGKP